MSTLHDLQAELRRRTDPEKADFLRRFFKTGPGQYAEGDRFRGITVPVQRALAKAHPLGFDDAALLLESDWHEDRLVALFQLMALYARGAPPLKSRIHRHYLARVAARVNNWDLVDASAAALAGAHLFEGGDAALLEKLAREKNLWRRRVGIVATHHFIRQGVFAPTLRVAEALLDDREDLIHKATGWMLREMGKKDERPLREFLDAHAAVMPRTMLRYAIERMTERERRRYMGMKGAKAER